VVFFISVQQNEKSIRIYPQETKMKNIRLATLTAITLAFTAPLLPAFADDNDDIAAVQQWQSKAESGDAEAQSPYPSNQPTTHALSDTASG